MTERTDIAFVLVDWGTSHLRLWAVDDGGAVLAEAKSGEGMGATAPSAFEGILDHHLTELDVGTDVPVMMCGMVGSRQGWQEARYLSLPADLQSVADQAVRVSGIERDVRILPGIAERSRANPDVMRSEETQLVGLLAHGMTGFDLICMPGTHTKWVRIDATGRAVTGFATSLSGDLFAAVCAHTVLRHSVSGASEMDWPAFDAATAVARDRPATALMDLFAVRAKMLLEGFEADAARSAISGIVIGHDIAGALERFDPPQKVMLIGGGAQGPLYRRALQAAGIAVEEADGEELARAGLFAAALHIWPHRGADNEPKLAASHR